MTIRCACGFHKLAKPCGELGDVRSLPCDKDCDTAQRERVAKQQAEEAAAWEAEVEANRAAVEAFEASQKRRKKRKPRKAVVQGEDWG